MQVFLPDMMEVLQDGNQDLKMKALVVFRNVMAHLKRKEASPIAVQLVEKLLPLFAEVRLIWEPEPRRRALGNDSCPSAQPCERPSQQALLLSFLPRAPGQGLLASAAQPTFSLRAALRAPRAAPAALRGRTRCPPQTPCRGAGAEPLVHGPEALPRTSPVSSSARLGEPLP